MGLPSRSATQGVSPVFERGSGGDVLPSEGSPVLPACDFVGAESSILEMPESRRTVDPLAMALFGVVRELPADERQVLLSAIDGRLHGVGSERARLALEVLRSARLCRPRRMWRIVSADRGHGRWTPPALRQRSSSSRQKRQSSTTADRASAYRTSTSPSGCAQPLWRSDPA